MDFKRKKNTRQRGSRRHGGGSKKKRRGGGSQGGRGIAGMHKHKMTYMTVRFPDHFGYRGFYSRKKKGNAINISQLDMSKGEINLTEQGYSKLLSRGEVKKPLKIIVKAASAAAKQKIEAAGGTVQEE